MVHNVIVNPPDSINILLHLSDQMLTSIDLLDTRPHIRIYLSLIHI